MLENKNTTKKFIKRLNKQFLNYYNSSYFSKKYSDYQNHNEPSFWRYSVLNLAGSIRIEFRKWGTKPFFLILFKSNKILLELDLSRIITKNGLFTLYLNKPTNKDTFNVYKSNYKFVKKLPIEYRDAVKEQKINLNSGFNVNSSGFELCVNQSEKKFTNEIINLLDRIIKSDIEKSIQEKGGLKSKVYALDDVQAEEGYQEDKRYLLTKRNSSIVQKRKILDKFTCQVCGFYLKIKNKYIIECHHLKPLSSKEDRVTKIQDLVSICPTCHRIAHLKKPPYSIVEIKKLRNN